MFSHTPPDLATIEKALNKKDYKQARKMLADPVFIKNVNIDLLKSLIIAASKLNDPNEKKQIIINEEVVKFINKIFDLTQKIYPKNGLQALLVAESQEWSTPLGEAKKIENENESEDLNSALSEAINHNNITLVKLLLDYGVPAHTKNIADGQIPIVKAMNEHRDDIVKLILQHPKFVPQRTAINELIKLANEKNHQEIAAAAQACLDQNTNDILAIAKFAVERTRKVIPYSTNLPDRKQKLPHRSIFLNLMRRTAKTPQQKKIVKELYDWHLDLSSEKQRYPLADSKIWFESLQKEVNFKNIVNDVIKKIPEMKEKTPTHSIEWIETSAVKSLKFGIGNCAETSAYTMMLLLEYPAAGLPNLPAFNRKISVERMLFPAPYDHTFLVLNRDRSKNIKEVMTWNDDTVVCDSWTNEVYTIKQLFANKNEAEQDYLIRSFLTANIATPSVEKNYFIGRENNENPIHSEAWERKHQNNISHRKNKFWRPKLLMDVVERPKFAEKLPKHTRIHKKIIIDQKKVSPKIRDLQNQLKFSWMASPEIKSDQVVSDKSVIDIKSDKQEPPSVKNEGKQIKEYKQEIVIGRKGDKEIVDQLIQTKYDNENTAEGKKNRNKFLEKFLALEKKDQITIVKNKSPTEITNIQISLKNRLKEASVNTDRYTLLQSTYELVQSTASRVNTQDLELAQSRLSENIPTESREMIGSRVGGIKK